MPTELFLIGAGGHGRVVLDAILLSRGSDVVELWDDDPELTGNSVLGVVVRAPVDVLNLPVEGHIAIGDNESRGEVAGRCLRAGKRLATIIHPRANVSRFAELDDGVFVAAAAVVAPLASIGTGVIVNHGVMVDHDCVVDSFAHLAPGAVLGGGVRVGQRALVGAGAVVKPGLSLGDGCTIGAGAVVTRSVSPGAVVAGVPARSIKP